MKGKGTGWHGESRRHSLARKGVSTVIDKDRRLAVNNFVARGDGGVKYLGEGRSMHGYLDRSWDEHLFEDEDGEEVSVIVFTEPDWDMLREIGVEEGMTDEEYEKYSLKESIRFEKEGEVQVIWAGAVDFMGTEAEFKKEYPDLYHAGKMGASGNIKHFGSQAREKIEDTDEGYKVISKKGNEVVLFNPDSNTYERWYKNDDHAGYTIEINGKGYEFANSMRKGKVFKVWSGRHSKIIEADDHTDARIKSGYINVDQIDRIG